MRIIRLPDAEALSNASFTSSYDIGDIEPSRVTIIKLGVSATANPGINKNRDMKQINNLLQCNINSP
jgi:hypothetical protein